MSTNDASRNVLETWRKSVSPWRPEDEPEVTRETVTRQLFVGADNATGLIDLDQIAEIVGRLHQGFTILPAVGYWQGKREPSCIVIVSDYAGKIARTIETLRDELSQDAIGWAESETLHFAA